MAQGRSHKTVTPALMVLADSALHSIVLACPTTIPALLQVSGIGPRIADTHGAAICALCDDRDDRAIPSEYGDTTVTQPAPKTPAKPKSQQRSLVSTVQAHDPDSAPAETFQRHRPITSDPAEALPPDQQALDQPLREWRKPESEKLGLPQFFVLGSPTLRTIVLLPPQPIPHLKTISAHGTG